MAKRNAVAGYVLVLLILAVLTYVEFLIVEHPQEWLGRMGTLISLIVMSVGKFILVIWYFMHLGEDDAVYSGWFASGMLLALASFIGMVVMFIYPSAMQTFPEDAVTISSQARAADGVDRIADDGALTRTPAEAARNPAPSNLSVPLTAPTVAPSEATVTQPQTEDAQEGEEAAPAEAEVEVVDISWDEELGATFFANRCASCHQVNGTGIPGAFPPLQGHAADVFAVDGGREYLINVLLFGVTGEIEVDGNTYSGIPMPGWASYSNDELAAVTNHIVAGWAAGAPEGFAPFAAEEFEENRANEYSDSDVYELRNTLNL